MRLNSICNRLSPRERDVLDAILLGEKQKEAGRRLGLSPRTVETYTTRIRRKLGARTTLELVRIALVGS